VNEAAILEGLNPEQRRAAEQVEGSVCILAGAGSGKTTTITRRLANQVAAGAFAPDSLLAVTFTRKAAGEMRTRLARLGIEGVRAMTFHAAALDQLRAFRPDERFDVLSSKGEILFRIARTLPKPHTFVPLMDLASEIEWAKNQRMTVERYRAALGAHEPPIPEDHMERVYASYERQKHARNAMDFEDILEATIGMFARDSAALAGFRSRIRALTVDEYQDVNLLQQTLLDTWLGDRPELCAVGDDYQAIYSFTGATPRYLLEMHERYPDLEVIRLERNYRSTPQILDVANRLARHLGGAHKILTAERPPGEEPVVKAFFDEARETSFLLDRIGALHHDGVPYEEMAVFYRTNARSELYEDVLSRAGIPYQVRDGAFLERPAAARLLPRLKRARTTSIAEETLRLARAEGMRDEMNERAGQQEATRQKDLAQLVDLAAEYEDGTRTARDFVVHLGERFGAGAKGVNLLTLHSAKGLEFDAVFIPSLEEGELPYRRATDGAIPEERRLLYVGLTRARRFLHVTWTIKRPSRFVAEIKPAAARAEATLAPSPPEPVVEAREGLELEVSGGFAGVVADVREDGALLSLTTGTELFVRYGDRVSAGDVSAPLAPPRSGSADDLSSALRAWRKERALADSTPAYVVMHDSTLEQIAEAKPASLEELIAISGMGPTKCERYGADIIRLCRSEE
jgi:DNA helicase-2/ATP-dependent DNA helicase PcrA